MVRVAVLGGSGHVGKTLVEILSQDPRHTVIVLGRSAPKHTFPQATYVAVDYSESASITSILEQHEVHTVISCLMTTDQRIADAQLAVITAADKSSCTRRFIASNWGPPTLPEYRDRSPWYPFQLDAHAQLRKTTLEWTEIATGYFLDYWGMPHIKTNMSSDMPALDIVHGVAGIPGTGDEPIAFAYTYDVARVVAEVLLSMTWEEKTYIVADKLTWNEFLALAEEARGFRFDVSYDSAESLAKGEMTELPNHRESYAEFPRDELVPMYAGIGLSMTKGTFDLDVSKSVHQKLGLKMMTVREMLHDVWELRRKSSERASCSYLIHLKT